VVDVQGVGYELLVSLYTFGDLPDVGKTVALHVRTIAREDAQLLYGFTTSREKTIFELLLRANRIGPRLAQTILSGIEPDRVLAGLAGGDVTLLCKAPGVGKKMAERMVVELRERAGELHQLSPQGTPGSGEATPDAPTPDAEIRDQVLSALVNLGYPKGQAEKLVDAAATEAGEGASIESWIRTALRSLAR